MNNEKEITDKQQQEFVKEVVQLKGEKFNFVKIGMKVEFGDKKCSGIIIGVNKIGNFYVKFSDESNKFKFIVSFNPYKMRYFDENDNLIISF